MWLLFLPGVYLSVRGYIASNPLSCWFDFMVVFLVDPFGLNVHQES